MPAVTDIVTALAAAFAAATQASRLQANVTRTDKADGSPVTEGDLAADAAIRSVLARRCPGDAILSEEQPDDRQRLTAKRVWIIDPIDGTKEYLVGRADWAVQVALAEDGVLTLGVLAMPGLGITAVGIPGVGAWEIVDDRRKNLHCASGNNDVMIATTSPRNRPWLEKVQAALPDFSTVLCHSIGVKTWHIIAGKAALYVHAGPLAEWDAAAPAALLLAAGGTATDLAGNPLRFNTASALCPGVVFSRRADHTVLIARLKQGGLGMAE